jgi:hypothetical protein
MNIPACTAEHSLHKSTRAYAAGSSYADVRGNALVPAGRKVLPKLTTRLGHTKHLMRRVRRFCGAACLSWR